jgi:hypothetical protein
VLLKQEIRGGKQYTKTAATLKKVLKFSVRTFVSFFERDLVLKAAKCRLRIYLEFPNEA